MNQRRTPTRPDDYAAGKIAAAKARGVKLCGKREGAGAPPEARERGTEALQAAANARAAATYATLSPTYSGRR